MSESAGSVLREWRKERRYSQLQLSLELDITSKHISFIETGRALPSRGMILKMTQFLQMPKCDVNRVLQLAGYAAAYTELHLSDNELKPVLNAIAQTITNHMPYPALVLNQYWDIVSRNDSAQKLLNDLGYSNFDNIIEALLSDNPQSSKIINCCESLYTVLQRIRYEISLLGGSRRLEHYQQKLIAYLNAQNFTPSNNQSQLILATQFNLGNIELSFFSIIAQLGSVQDVSVSEFKIELMFPNNDATKKYYEREIL